MRNKYGGDCYRCGKWCAPGAGHFERVPGRGWRVQHADCAIEHRGTKTVAASDDRAAGDNPEGLDYSDIF